MPTRLFITRPDGPAFVDIEDDTLVLTPDLQFVEPRFAEYILATAAPIQSSYTPFTVDQIATVITTAAVYSYGVSNFQTVPTVENPDPSLIVVTDPDPPPPSVIVCTGVELTFVPVTVLPQT